MESYEANIGGVPLTAAAIRQAADILEDAPGNHVRGPLARAGHALAHAPERDWYHGAYREEIGRFPHLRVRPGSTRDHRAHVKPAVIHYLRRLAGEA